jgi:hypothetical protein
MPRLRKTLLGTAAALLAACAVSVPAASADTVLQFTNYQVGGTLTLAKLHQSISLPPGSTFNGSANLTTQQISGHVSVPEFTSTLTILGIPTHVTTKLEEAQPLQGTVSLDPDFTLHLRANTSAILRIKNLRIGLLSVPTTCRTAAPIVLTTNFDGRLAFPLAFDGTTTIPSLTGCGLLGPTLGLLLSGPGNAYHLTLSPPVSG